MQARHRASDHQNIAIHSEFSYGYFCSTILFQNKYFLHKYKEYKHEKNSSTTTYLLITTKKENIHQKSQYLSHFSLIWSSILEPHHLKHLSFIITGNVLACPQLFSIFSNCRIQSMVTQSEPFLARIKPHTSIKVIRSCKVKHGISKLLAWINLVYCQRRNGQEVIIYTYISLTLISILLCKPPLQQMPMYISLPYSPGFGMAK